MHDPLGDPLVVEVGDLLAEMEVLEQRRTSTAGLQEWSVSGSRNPEPSSGTHRPARASSPSATRIRLLFSPRSCLPAADSTAHGSVSVAQELLRRFGRRVRGDERETESRPIVESFSVTTGPSFTFARPRLLNRLRPLYERAVSSTNSTTNEPPATPTPRARASLPRPVGSETPRFRSAAATPPPGFGRRG